MKIWQVAAGDPGHMRDVSAKYDGFSSAKVGALRDFCRKVEPGDFVIMRVGAQALSVGIVPESDYTWCQRFDDVHGWDLQHTRRVCWLDEIEDTMRGLQTNHSLFSGRWSMFSRVHGKAMLDKVRPLLDRCEIRSLKAMPESAGPLLMDEEAGELLFSHGLPQGGVDALLASISRQRRLLRWYKEHGTAVGRPTEHEVVAYMVLPMLLALGWSEQLLAVEWNKIDLAAFRRTPTTASACAMVCEAKGMNAGLQGPAYGQAQRYVKTQRLTSCQHILLTQGERFYLYDRDDDETWQAEPNGYLNLTKLRAGCVLPRNTNAIDTLMALTPQRVFGANGQ